jgi:hypothetical protein
MATRRPPLLVQIPVMLVSCGWVAEIGKIDKTYTPSPRPSSAHFHQLFSRAMAACRQPCCGERAIGIRVWRPFPGRILSKYVGCAFYTHAIPSGNTGRRNGMACKCVDRLYWRRKKLQKWSVYGAAPQKTSLLHYLRRT